MEFYRKNLFRNNRPNIFNGFWSERPRSFPHQISKQVVQNLRIWGFLATLNNKFCSLEFQLIGLDLANILVKSRCVGGATALPWTRNVLEMVPTEMFSSPYDFTYNFVKIRFFVLTGLTARKLFKNKNPSRSAASGNQDIEV